MNNNEKNLLLPKHSARNKSKLYGTLWFAIHVLILPFFREVCPEMHGNEIHTLYDRHHKVSPSPNPHHKASNSVKHEDIWKLQLIVCNMKYPRSQLCAFLDVSVFRRNL